MFKSLSQIVGSLLTLIALLILPYIIGLNLASDEFFRNPEIIGSSNYKSNYKSDYKFSFSEALEPNSMEQSFSAFERDSLINFISYTLGLLILISVYSFVKYKIDKK